MELDDMTGRLVVSAVLVVVSVVVAWAAGMIASARIQDPTTSYYVRKVIRYVVVFVVLVALGVVWRAFAGRAGVVLGFTAAGVAFAIQEVNGALAGWVNIVSGRIFRIGDRIEMGGVLGDVIDVSPLRSKVMEIGGGDRSASWVQGRQLTGRIVSISNKTTFTQPVFNFSASFDFVWDEFTLPISYDEDWERAAVLMQQEADRSAATGGAADAVDRMKRRYPVPAAELTPRVYATPTDDYVQLTARFVLPVRTARPVKDTLARRTLHLLAAEGIHVASTTTDVRVRIDEEGRTDEQSTEGAGG